MAALGRGAGQQASLGFGDEMGGLGSWLASLNPDVPVGPDGAFAGGRNQERGANAQARADQPGAYGVGEVIGGAGPAIAGGALVSKVAPAFAALA